MKVIKRDGEEVVFSKTNIINAISKANQRVKIDERFTNDEIKNIAKSIEERCKQETHAVNVEDIQEFIENALMEQGKFNIAREYITYRYQRYMNRQKNTTDDKILALLENRNEEIKQENANKNPTIASTMRDYMAGEVSKDISKRYLIPSDIIKAHEDGIIHFHDMDYFAQPIYNCCVWNLEDILQNGTVINGVKIDKPHTFLTACTIASQVSAIIASNQYGGQTFSLAHLAPFVQDTRDYYRRKLSSYCTTLTDTQLDELVEAETMKNIKDGIQTLQYQLVTISSTNGQTPFVSMSMYLNEAKNEQEKADLALIIEEVLRQRIVGIKNKNGQYFTNAFPKLLYFLEEDNTKEGDKYYYLTQLAAECTMKRMVPDYISEKIMLEQKKDKKGRGYAFPCMGCRSFLSVWTDPSSGEAKFYGRFNKGVVTINLPYVGLLANKDIEKFWYILDQKLELCHRALRLRHEHLVDVTSDVAPTLWQYGAIARLAPGEKINKLLYGGYSTISLGYVGLWETVYALIGEDTWTDEGKELAVQIMECLKTKCDQWDSIEHIGYSVYGTPEESTTYKFAKALQKTFGNDLHLVTDKNYVTNSYHVPVWYGLEDGMNAFRKIDIEQEFQKYSTGGAISYVEMPKTDNKEAVLSVIRYIYDNIMYCELNNMGSTICHECGEEGTIEIRPDENGKLHWVCSNCGNEDSDKMTITVRVCGYLSSGNDINQGRMADVASRKTHL